ncbi:MAG: hypothetical protein ACO3UU_17160, partial [Minisyncoccia bacterium]
CTVVVAAVAEEGMNSYTLHPMVDIKVVVTVYVAVVAVLVATVEEEEVAVYGFVVDVLLEVLALHMNHKLKKCRSHQTCLIEYEYNIFIY